MTDEEVPSGRLFGLFGSNSEHPFPSSTVPALGSDPDGVGDEGRGLPMDDHRCLKAEAMKAAYGAPMTDQEIADLKANPGQFSKIVQGYDPTCSETSHDHSTSSCLGPVGGVVKSPTTIRDELNEKYFTAGYRAGQRDATERPPGKVFVLVTDREWEIICAIREAAETGIEVVVPDS